MRACGDARMNEEDAGAREVRVPELYDCHRVQMGEHEMTDDRVSVRVCGRGGVKCGMAQLDPWRRYSKHEQRGTAIDSLSHTLIAQKIV